MTQNTPPNDTKPLPGVHAGYAGEPPVSNLDERMIDLHEADKVEVLIDGANRFWVNVDERCRLRIGRAKSFTFETVGNTPKTKHKPIEYKTLIGNSPNVSEYQLNEFGAEGWILCSIYEAIGEDARGESLAGKWAFIFYREEDVG